MLSPKHKAYASPSTPRLQKDVEEKQKMWRGGRARGDGRLQGVFLFVSDIAEQQNI